MNSLCDEPLLSTLIPILLAIPGATVFWAMAGLAFILFLIYCVRTGEIPSADGAPYTRATDHFHYNAYIFWAALLAVIFIGAAISFYYYPNASKPMIRDEVPANF